MFGSAIVLDADTRWNIHIRVDNLTKDVGEASTGLQLNGYGANNRFQQLVLVYQYGTWNLGYYDVDTSKKLTEMPPPIFWNVLKFQTDPNQQLELTIGQQGQGFYLTKPPSEYQFIKSGTDIFDKSDIIVARVQTGPRTKATVSGLMVEQYRLPSVITLTSLKEPYILDFEALDANKPNDTSPFTIPARLDMFGNLAPWFAQNVKVQGWALDLRAHTGLVAINGIPGGNPGNTQYMTGLTMSVLGPVFDVTGHEQVELSLWINTTSNPRRASVHNCDSEVAVYYRIDGKPLEGNSIICGEYKKESQGWHQVSRTVDVSGKKTIQFALGYALQNSFKPDPFTYYLIDDIQVSAK